MPPKPKNDSAALNEVLEALEEAEGHHVQFREEVENSYRAYRGDLERTSEAAQWESSLHPPYIQHQVEVSVASLVDQEPLWFVDAFPREATDEEFQLLEAGADALEKLLRVQMHNDRFKEKLRPALLQDAIAGLTPLKVIWKRQEETRRRRIVEANEDGTVFMGEQEVDELVMNQPVVLVKDIRDWLWPEAATSVEKAEWIIDRSWMTKEELQRIADNNENFRNVSKIKDLNEDFADNGPDRDTTLWGVNRTKNRVEVLEYWTNDYVITVANRNVVLQNAENPYWHKRKPFVTMTTQSELFRIPGTSQVKKVAHLQEMLWSLQNQRIDSLTMLINAIAMIRSDVDDPDEFEFAPRARWLVEDPNQVVMWTPNPLPAQLSIPAEGLVKGDLQNLSGSFPFASATDSQTIDQETATGATIISNIAQRSLQHKKNAVDQTFERVGQMELELNQQFIDEDQLVRDIGIDDEFETTQITPTILGGDFRFRLRVAEDSTMRNEKRQEAVTKLQVLLQVAPIAAQLSQMGAARMINMDVAVKDFLEAHGEENAERFFISQQAGPVPGASPTASQQGPGGVTAPGAAPPNGSQPGTEQGLTALMNQLGG